MRIRNLSYRHRAHAPYLFRNLHFVLEPGKLHALHGKNGTGKSVLLHLLNGDRLSEGVLEGEIQRHGAAALVNQKFDQMIADQFSFDENLRLACMRQLPSLFSTLKEPDLVFEALERFQIDRNIPVCRLSGGQRQILSILMSLQKQIKYLFLDEPTAAMDEENASLVFDFLSLLTEKGMTVFAVCHDRELIYRYVTGSEWILKKTDQGTEIILLE
ncbi:MAG: ATP-binding cassette domain-containing protein [Parachlamydiaceae bacterium]